MNRWNLDGIEFEMSSAASFACDFLARRKIQEIEDAYRAASIVPKRERAIFIENNIEALVVSGNLEKILFEFYILLDFPIYSLGIEVWTYLFDCCDRRKLLAEGDEIPKELGSEFTIYRGQNFEEDPGISWSLSREKAAWFASARSKMLLNGKGEVGVIDMRVTIDDILFYTNRREEQEVVISPYVHHCGIL